MCRVLINIVPYTTGMIQMVTMILIMIVMVMVLLGMMMTMKRHCHEDPFSPSCALSFDSKVIAIAIVVVSVAAMTAVHVPALRSPPDALLAC